MTTVTIREITSEEFNNTSNPLADSIYAHYAHATM